MIPIPLGGPPLADFTQPLQMLEDCHRRIEHFLDVLRKVATQFGDGELTDEARRALTVSLTYFSEAAPRHTADEEESLFPRMRASADPTVRAALEELDQLEGDHRRAERLHEQVDVIGRRWLEVGSLASPELAELRKMLDELVAIYAEHIRHEEERVFTMAADAIGDQDLQTIGAEMRRRRNLPPAKER